MKKTRSDDMKRLGLTDMKRMDQSVMKRLRLTDMKKWIKPIGGVDNEVKNPCKMF